MSDIQIAHECDTLHVDLYKSIWLKSNNEKQIDVAKTNIYHSKMSDIISPEHLATNAQMW